MSRLAPLALASIVLAFAPTAVAVGPSLGTLNGGNGVEAPAEGISYVTRLQGAHTSLAELDTDGTVVRSARLAGAWGIPLVTINGESGGLSRNGRVLVLGDNTSPGGGLRSRSGFAVTDARTLALRDTIHLRGDFSFDALSPRGSTLYLIQHTSATGSGRYRVRAYDLKAGRLLPGVIADKRQAGWTMSGFPVARSTSANGRWVYTLYDQGDNYPFVHALDTLHRAAVCIGLPWDWAQSGEAIPSATLRLERGKLLIAGGHGSSTRFVLDTRNFEVAASGEHTTT